MKTNRLFFHSVLALVTLTFGCSSIRESINDKKSTVVRLVGTARFSADGGKKLNRVKLGDLVSEGILLQTAEQSAMYVALGEKMQLPRRASGLNGVPYDPVKQPYNLMRLSGGSIVTLQAVGRTKNQLALRSGAMLLHVKPESSGSSFEVSLATGRAFLKSGVYHILDPGVISTLDGLAVVTVGMNANEVPPGSTFDAATGVMTNFPSLGDNWRHDVWLPSDPVYIDWATPREKGR